MKSTEKDPLALPNDWQEKVTALLHENAANDYKEYSWEATYKAAWEECAALARAQLTERVSDLMRGMVSAKDARIRELERDNAALKAQLDELEELLPQ